MALNTVNALTKNQKENRNNSAMKKLIKYFYILPSYLFIGSLKAHSQANSMFLF